MNLINHGISWLDAHSGAAGFLGAVIAVFFSTIGFFLKSWLDKRSERKEHLRKVEVCITTSLNQLLDAREQLRFFIKNLDKLITDINEDNDPHHIRLETVRFPAISKIYEIPEVIGYKTKSYYLHNNMLFSFKGIMATNVQIEDFKDGLSGIDRKNDRLIDLMMQTGLNAQSQKNAYAENLGLFRIAVEGYQQHMKQGIELLLRVKIYNEHMRKVFGWWFLWRLEGRSFKYFYNKTAFDKFSRSLGSLDRIDAALQKEVDEELRKIEEKAPHMLTEIGS